MKQKLLYGLFALLLALPGRLAAQPLSITPVKSQLKEVCIERDTVWMKLSLDFSGLRLKTMEQLTLTPVLTDGIHRVVLPAIVVNGKLRRSYYSREQQVVFPLRPRPFAVLSTRKGEELKPLEYRASTPYAWWIPTARLLLEEHEQGCCDDWANGAMEISQVLNGTPYFVAPSLAAPHIVAPRDVALSDAVSCDSTRFPVVVARDSVLLAQAPVIPVPEPPLTVATPIIKHNPGPISCVLYLDYPQGGSQVLPHFNANRAELARLDSTLTPILAADIRRTLSFRVIAYASPEGSYAVNERLVRSRADSFRRYLSATYPVLTPDRMVTDWVPEDWDGLVAQLRNCTEPFVPEALHIIDTYGIFNFREKHLMELRAGEPYRYMLKNQFPSLRRIEIIIEYE